MLQRRARGQGIFDPVHVVARPIPMHAGGRFGKAVVESLVLRRAHDDEAPGADPPVVGRALRGAQDQFQLGIVGRGRLHEGAGQGSA